MQCKCTEWCVHINRTIAVCNCNCTSPAVKAVLFILYTPCPSTKCMHACIPVPVRITFCKCTCIYHTTYAYIIIYLYIGIWTMCMCIDIWYYRNIYALNAYYACMLFWLRQRSFSHATAFVRSYIIYTHIIIWSDYGTTSICKKKQTTYTNRDHACGILLLFIWAMYCAYVCHTVVHDTIGTALIDTGEYCWILRAITVWLQILENLHFYDNLVLESKKPVEIDFSKILTKCTFFLMKSNRIPFDPWQHSADVSDQTNEQMRQHHTYACTYMTIIIISVTLLTFSMFGQMRNVLLNQPDTCKHFMVCKQMKWNVVFSLPLPMW